MSTTNPARREPFVTIQFVARHLGVTPRTIRNYISEGYFPAYRIRGARGVRLRLSEVDAAMRLIPTSKARPGMPAFGPKARIVNVVEAVDPFAPVTEGAAK